MAGGVPAPQGLQAMVKVIKRASMRARDSSDDHEDDRRPVYTNVSKKSQRLVVLEVYGMAGADAG